MIALSPEDQPLIDALSEATERRRVLVGWAEIAAVRRERYTQQMAAVRPKMEDEANG